MSKWGRVVWPILILVCAVLAIGCNPLPVSQHALSDDHSSAPDDGLLGYWRQGDPQQPGKADPDAVTMAIGRSPDGTQALEIVGLEIDDAGRVRVRRAPLWTTQVEVHTQVEVQRGASADGQRQRLHIASIRLRDLEPEKKLDGYWLLLYERSGPRRVRWYHMDPPVVARAIESGQLAGRVRRNPRAGQPIKLLPGAVEPEFAEIRITAEPAALRSYLSHTGVACFDMEQPLLELLKLARPGSAAAGPNGAPVKPGPPPPTACSAPAD